LIDENLLAEFLQNFGNLLARFAFRIRKYVGSATKS
jgi:hypothetical protein